MIVKLQFRRDIAANWSAANPVLLLGEMGVETDTQQFKLGNGSTAWNALTYGGLQGDQGVMGSLLGTKVIAGASYQIAPADDGYLLWFTSGVAVTVTFPVNLPNGFSALVAQGGVGQVTVVGASGVTVAQYAGSKTAGQFAAITLVTPVANTVLIAGQTA